MGCCRRVVVPTAMNSYKLTITMESIYTFAYIMCYNMLQSHS
ncbi:unnamed protein product [Haemonchus placei]|uniref:Uncharacterized protein n=1 Tax=Haemonchus placei TaxID=6290 RepID=A0A0N4WV86_HAEPC|nr:unnamed protein product [Haemonchus placei]